MNREFRFQMQSFRNKWRGNYWENSEEMKNPIVSLMPNVIFGSPCERFAFFMIPMKIDFKAADESLAI